MVFFFFFSSRRRHTRLQGDWSSDVCSSDPFQVDAFPGEQFHGRVSTVRLNATTVQNVVTYSTIIDFENPDEILLPGETAYVTIPTGQADNVIMIPNAALSYVPDMPFADLRALYVANKISPAAYRTHLGGAQVVWTKTADG